MRSPIQKALIYVILLTFNLTGLHVPVANADELFLPKPGVRVGVSPTYNPPILKGVTVDPKNPFKFDFILDQGDSKLSSPSASTLPSEPGSHVKATQGVNRSPNEFELKKESAKLVRYFLSALTTPENDLWVNLSPYERNRIIPESFGQTEMGRDLLAQDYLLKQITATLMYPEDEIGKKFWKRIYERAAKEFGTTNIPVNTFNKVWIVPNKAKVYEHNQTAFIVNSNLKVMLESDYLAQEKNVGATEWQKQIIREIIIPELEKEVNEGKNFAPLRQVYQSLILATWFKQRLKNSLLGKKYIDQNKINGIRRQPGDMFQSEQQNVSPRRSPSDQGMIVRTSQVNPFMPNKQSKIIGQDIDDVELIYQRYLTAYKKGVFNFIKEEQDTITNQSIPRKYFSGGFLGQFKIDYAMSVTKAEITVEQPLDVAVQLKNVDLAMNTTSHKEFLSKVIAELTHVINGSSEPLDDIYFKINSKLSLNSQELLNQYLTRVNRGINQPLHDLTYVAETTKEEWINKNPIVVLIALGIYLIENISEDIFSDQDMVRQLNNMLEVYNAKLGDYLTLKGRLLSRLDVPSLLCLALFIFPLEKDLVDHLLYLNKQLILLPEGMIKEQTIGLGFLMMAIHFTRLLHLGLGDEESVDYEFVLDHWGYIEQQWRQGNLVYRTALAKLVVAGDISKNFTKTHQILRSKFHAHLKELDLDQLIADVRDLRQRSSANFGLAFVHQKFEYSHYYIMHHPTLTFTELMFNFDKAENQRVLRNIDQRSGFLSSYDADIEHAIDFLEQLKQHKTASESDYGRARFDKAMHAEESDSNETTANFKGFSYLRAQGLLLKEGQVAGGIIQGVMNNNANVIYAVSDNEVIRIDKSKKRPISLIEYLLMAYPNLPVPPIRRVGFINGHLSIGVSRIEGVSLDKISEKEKDKVYANLANVLADLASKRIRLFDMGIYQFMYGHEINDPLQDKVWISDFDTLIRDPHSSVVEIFDYYINYFEVNGSSFDKNNIIVNQLRQLKKRVVNQAPIELNINRDSIGRKDLDEKQNKTWQSIRDMKQRQLETMVIYEIKSTPAQYRGYRWLNAAYVDLPEIFSRESALSLLDLNQWQYLINHIEARGLIINMLRDILVGNCTVKQLKEYLINIHRKLLPGEEDHGFDDRFLADAQKQYFDQLMIRIRNYLLSDVNDIEGINQVVHLMVNQRGGVFAFANEPIVLAIANTMRKLKDQLPFYGDALSSENRFNLSANQKIEQIPLTNDGTDRVTEELSEGSVKKMQRLDQTIYFLKNKVGTTDSVLQEDVAYRIAKWLGVNVPALRIIGKKDIQQLSTGLKQTQWPMALMIQDIATMQLGELAQIETAGIEEFLLFSALINHDDYSPEKNINWLQIRGKEHLIAFDFSDLSLLDYIRQEQVKLDSVDNLLAVDSWYNFINLIDAQRLEIVLRRFEQMNPARLVDTIDYLSSQEKSNLTAFLKYRIKNLRAIILDALRTIENENEGNFLIKQIRRTIGGDDFAMIGEEFEKIKLALPIVIKQFGNPAIAQQAVVAALKAHDKAARDGVGFREAFGWFTTILDPIDNNMVDDDHKRAYGLLNFLDTLLLFSIKRERTFQRTSKDGNPADLPKDSAMGGIDLTARRMNIAIDRDNAQIAMPMDDYALENLEINGLAIESLELKLLTNLPQLLGVGE